VAIVGAVLLLAVHRDRCCPCPALPVAVKQRPWDRASRRPICAASNLQHAAEPGRKLLAVVCDAIVTRKSICFPA
jgi:hypothetical protein